MVPRDTVRVLVVGDAGVGKTSLVHLLCHGEVAKKVSYTVGAELDVMVHAVPGKAVFVEFVDVGGSSAFEHSRCVWYRSFDGILGVYDAANTNSRNNLDLWLREAVSLTGVDVLPWRAEPEGLVLDLAVHLDRRLAGRRVPVLLAANKRDLLRGQPLAAAAADDWLVCSLDVSAAEAGEVKLAAFLTAVVRASESSSAGAPRGGADAAPLTTPVKLGLGELSPFKKKRDTEMRLRIDV